MGSRPPLDTTTFHNIINGELRSASEFRHGIDPSTRKKLWPVPCATAQDVDDAVKAARNAFPAWSQRPYDERSGLVQTYAKLYLHYEEEMTDLLMRETGKPVSMRDPWGIVQFQG